MAKKSSLFYLSASKKKTEKQIDYKNKDKKPAFYEAIAGKRKKR